MEEGGDRLQLMPSMERMEDNPDKGLIRIALNVNPRSVRVPEIWESELLLGPRFENSSNCLQQA